MRIKSNLLHNSVIISLISMRDFTNLYICCYNLIIQILIIMTPEAERFNGWAAMLGFVAAVGAYVTTGQIIPGWF